MECAQLAAAFESQGCPRAPPSRFDSDSPNLLPLLLRRLRLSHSGGRDGSRKALLFVLPIPRCRAPRNANGDQKQQEQLREARASLLSRSPGWFRSFAPPKVKELSHDSFLYHLVCQRSCAGESQRLERRLVIRQRDFGSCEPSQQKAQRVLLVDPPSQVPIRGQKAIV